MDVYKNAHLQRELLRAAVDCCKPGGTIVYSTCSIAVEENEAVIDYILKKRFVKIVDSGLPIEREGMTSYNDITFDPRVKLSRRVINFYYPTRSTLMFITWMVFLLPS